MELLQNGMDRHDANMYEDFVAYEERMQEDAKEELRERLGHAIRTRSIKDVRVLVSQGAPLLGEFELDSPDEKGNALDLAIFCHRPDLAFEMLKLALPKSPAAEARSQAGPGSLELVTNCRYALVWTARDGRTDLLCSMLEATGNPLQKDREGRSALQMAALRGHQDCAESLLRRGAWDEEPDKEHVRRWTNHWRIRPTFEAVGAAVGIQPLRAQSSMGNRRSPYSDEERSLSAACGSHPVPSVPARSSQKEAAQAVAPSPARLTSDRVALLQLQEGLRNELMAALKADNKVDIEMLVQRGASLLPHYHSKRLEVLVDDEQELGGDFCPKGPASALVNPVDWAALEGCFSAATSLLELADGTVHFGRDECQTHFTRLELARGTRKAVHCAAFRGETRLLKGLLERHADPGQKNFQDESALFVAVRENQAQAAEILLAHGAWQLEDRKHGILERAGARRMACILNVAGVTAKLEGLGALASAPPPPWEDMVRDLCAAPLQSDKTFQIDRILECSEAKDRSCQRWQRPESPPTRSPTRQSNLEEELDRPPAIFSDVRSSCVQFHTEMTAAIKKGDCKRISSIVKFRAPLDGAFDLGYGECGNCIDWACVSKQPAVALLLLQLAESSVPGLAEDLARGARAALLWSVIEGYTEVLRELLRLGANPGQRCAASSGDSALALAISSWREEAALELLRYGAWDSEPQASRRDILRQAQVRRPIAEALQRAGADIGLPSESGSLGIPPLSSVQATTTVR